MHWWLPNEEGYPSIIKSIRRFVEERTAPAKDVSTEDLRDMKAIFSSLRLDDGKSSMPPKKGDGRDDIGAIDVALARDWNPSLEGSGREDIDAARLPEDDTYGFDHSMGHGYWDQGHQDPVHGDPGPHQYQ